MACRLATAIWLALHSGLTPAECGWAIDQGFACDFLIAGADTDAS